MQLNGYPSLGCGPGILAKLALTPAQGASAGLLPQPGRVRGIVRGKPDRPSRVGGNLRKP